MTIVIARNQHPYFAETGICQSGWKKKKKKNTSYQSTVACIMMCFLLNTFYNEFSQKNIGCVLHCFSRSNSLLDISREWLVRLTWNEKDVHWLDTGWTMRPRPLISPMTLTLDFSRSNFKITVLRNCYLNDVKQKESRTIRCWAGCMVLPFDHTDPWPWPWSFNVNILNSLISGMGGMIDMEGKGCESTFHDYDCDLWITMVGWVDVPDSVQLREC